MVGRKKIYLNLGVYRNLHFQASNKTKIEFHKEVLPQILKLKRMDQIEIIYTLYPVSNRLIDIANVCCIVDKFFCDSLVWAERIIDDNHNFIKKVSYQFGEVDKKFPRVEAEIKEW